MPRTRPADISVSKRSRLEQLPVLCRDNLPAIPRAVSEAESRLVKIRIPSSTGHQHLALALPCIIGVVYLC